jgi:hypothetical protein
MGASSVKGSLYEIKNPVKAQLPSQLSDFMDKLHWAFFLQRPKKKAFSCRHYLPRQNK